MLKDEAGIITFPLKLLCYTILLGLIFSFIIQGIWNARIPVSETAVEREVSEILIAINSIQQGSPRNLLYSDASEGSKRVVKLNLPSNTAYLSLGSDPEVDSKAGSQIVYKVQGGGKRFEYLNINLCAASSDVNGVLIPSQNGLVLKSGSYTLTFEFVYDPILNEKWILIY
jgi:hypothetical protein